MQQIESKNFHCIVYVTHNLDYHLKLDFNQMQSSIETGKHLFLKIILTPLDNCWNKPFNLVTNFRNWQRSATAAQTSPCNPINRSIAVKIIVNNKLPITGKSLTMPIYKLYLVATEFKCRRLNWNIQAVTRNEK